MSATGFESFDHTLQLTYEWIGELADETGMDRQRAWRLLRAVLHGLRNALPLAEVADLAAQLPILIRGVYYEGWRPAHVYDRSDAAFRAVIDKAFSTDPLADTPKAVSLALGFLARKISAGEMKQVRESLPAGIRVYWPG